MSESRKPDWDPRSAEVLRDQLAAYDQMRESCPVAYSDFLHWSVFGHEDVTRVIADHAAFSNAVSQHLTVPAGMDPPEHTVYRRLIDPYFAPDRMKTFEPTCRRFAAELVREAVSAGNVEVMADLALPFAVKVQCAFLGWPADFEEPLSNWTRRNYEATLAQDRQAMSEIAREFEAIVDEMLDVRVQSGAAADEDVTAALTHEKVWGRPLTNEEISSILRTWTVGEIGSIASSVGILIHFLATHPGLQNEFRSDPSKLPAAIDEILRIHGPLVASRRITTCPVHLGGRKIDAGERLSLNWVSANRDPRVFEEPETFRLDRDPDANLLYGAGIHVCPGAPLARMEMRVMMEEVLKAASVLELISEKPPVLARYPASGYAVLPLRMRA